MRESRPYQIEDRKLKCKDPCGRNVNVRTPLVQR